MLRLVLKTKRSVFSSERNFPLFFKQSTNASSEKALKESWITTPSGLLDCKQNSTKKSISNTTKGKCHLIQDTVPLVVPVEIGTVLFRMAQPDTQRVVFCLKAHSCIWMQYARPRRDSYCAPVPAGGTGFFPCPAHVLSTRTTCYSFGIWSKFWPVTWLCEQLQWLLECPRERL